jgi:predicted N-formylglutamate amidohydrolase
MNETPDKLLAADEPAPVAVHNESGLSPFLIVADHAGNFVPRALGRLGVPEAELERHIAWDIGIAAVCRLWRTSSTPLWYSRITRAWSLTATACRDLRHRSRKSASLLQCLGTLA